MATTTHPTTQRAQRIFTIAWPLIIGAASTLLLTLADTAILGHYSTAAQATMAQAAVLFLVASAIISPLASSIHIVGAQRRGADDHGTVKNLLRQGLNISVPVGAIVGLAIIATAPLLVNATNLGATTEFAGQTTLATQILAASLPISMAAITCKAWLSAQELTKITMAATLITNLANIIFDVALVFGLNLGAIGSALGTTLGICCGAAYAGYQAVRVRRAITETAENSTSTASLARQLRKVAWRDMVFGAATYGADMLMMAAVTSFTATALAGYRIMGTTTALIFTFAFTCASAITITTAQEIGAGRLADARKYVSAGALVMTGFVGLVALPILFIPGLYLRLFTSDPAVVDVTAGPLIAYWLIIPALIAGMSLAGLVRGAGDTKSMMYIGLGAQFVVAMPLAWLFGPVLGWGLGGIALAMVCSWLCRLVLTLWRVAKLTDADDHPESEPSEPELSDQPATSDSTSS